MASIPELNYSPHLNELMQPSKGCFFALLLQTRGGGGLWGGRVGGGVQTATAPKAWNPIPHCVGETERATSKPHPSDSPQIPSAAVVFLSRGGSGPVPLRAVRAVRLGCS